MRHQVRNKKSSFFQFFLVFFLLTISSLFFLPAKAFGAEKLHVRLSKSFVRSGDSYLIYVFTNETKQVGYTGFLDVKVTACDVSVSPPACSTKIEPWGNYQIKNGIGLISLPSDMKPSTFRAQFRPRGSNWQWSNEVEMSVDTTYGLEDTKNYWLMPEVALIFKGENYIYNQKFTTWFGAYPPGDICGNEGQIMYHLKDSAEGYWNPKFPWLEGDYFKRNLLWHLVYWQKKSGWHDEYLTAWGHEEFEYNLEDPFNIEFNLDLSRKKKQTRYGSNHPEFPPYILSPRWLGKGWAIGNTQAYSIPFPPTIPFCNLWLDGREGGIWSVYADFVNLNLSLYSGPALKLTFYEGGKDFPTQPDSNDLGLREDWYFVKNIGLAKIDVKHFGPDFPYDNKFRRPCFYDPDCLTNQTMTSPHLSLTNVKFLINAQTLLKNYQLIDQVSDLNSDETVNGIDFSLIVR